MPFDPRKECELHSGCPARDLCYIAQKCRELGVTLGPGTLIATEDGHTPAPVADATEAILADRGKTHGDYVDHAMRTQELKYVMEYSRNWPGLNYSQREALHMIAHKIGRILAGNPNHKDHWDDIAGYARLVAKQLD